MNSVIDILYKTSTPITVLLMFAWYYVPISFCSAKRKFRDNVKKDPFGEYEQPGMASNLGVFGTFLGITIGLLGFNTAPGQMQESVTHLLTGMTTAFLTSIVGMWLSFSMKRYQEKIQIQVTQEGKVQENKTIADLIGYLQSERQERIENTRAFNRLIQVSSDKVCDALKDIRQSVVGADDYTVVGQMKKMRTDTAEKLQDIEFAVLNSNEQVQHSLKDFADTVAESNTRAFVKALSTAMKGFNSQLIEQFGQNFVQFNEAVGKLLAWQENYRKFLEDTTELHYRVFEEIDDVQKSLNKIEESAKGMTSTARGMTELIGTADRQNKRLQQELIAMDNFIKQMRDTLPEIQNIVDVNMNNISKSFAQLMQHIQDTEDEIDENSKKTIQLLDEQTQGAIIAIQKSAESLSKNSFNMTKTVSNQLKEMMETNNENLKFASENLSRDLDNKITESLNSLGQAMAQITNKFADDYTPLADKLRDVVRLAEKVQRK